jgi:hypothetical protein
LNITSKRVLAGLAVAATVVATSAFAITDSAFNYSAPKPGYFSISPMALSPDGNNSAFQYFTFYTGSFTGGGCYNTGVNIPQGATVTSVRIWSSSNADGVIFRMDALNLAAGNSTNVFTATAPVTGGARQVFVKPLNPPLKIGNAGQAYGFAICIDPGETFSGARIDYTYTNAGD